MPRFNYKTVTMTRLMKVLKDGPMDRDTIVAETKIPRTTVYDNLQRLEKLRKVKRFPKRNGKRGTPRIFWEIIPSISIQ